MRGVGSCALLDQLDSHTSVVAILVSVLDMGGAPYRHLGKLGCVRSDPYEPTSTGIGVGRGGAATQNAAHLDLYLEQNRRLQDWMSSISSIICIPPLKLSTP